MSKQPGTSMSSHTPLSLLSAAHVPPHSPRASNTLPSQSHSSSGMPVPPQMPHSSSTLPSQSQSPSGMSLHPHSNTALLLHTRRIRRTPSRNRLRWWPCCRSCRPKDRCIPRSSGIRTTHPRTGHPGRSCKHLLPCSQTIAPIATTNATLVKHVAIAIARARLNAFSATHATFVQNVAVTIAFARGDANSSTDATFVDFGTRTVFFSGFWVKVAGTRVCATENLVHITHTVAIDIGFARTATHPQGIQLVAVAIAIAFWDVEAPAFVNRTWPEAHVAFVFKTGTFFFRVANAVVIQIGRTIATTHANGVQLVAVAIAVAFRDVSTSTLVDLAGSIAHPASIQDANAIVHVVANAVFIDILCARASTHAEGVKLVPHCSRNLLRGCLDNHIRRCRQGHCRCHTHPLHPRSRPRRHKCHRHPHRPHNSATHANRVFLVAQAVAVPFRNVVASAFQIGPRPVAHATEVHNSNAIVHVVTNAVVVFVCSDNPHHIRQSRQGIRTGVVDGGRRVEVAADRRSIRTIRDSQIHRRLWPLGQSCTPWHPCVHFQLVAHAIAVGIVEIALTVVVHLGIVTRPSICRFGVVVASLRLDSRTISSSSQTPSPSESFTQFPSQP